MPKAKYWLYAGLDVHSPISKFGTPDVYDTLQSAQTAALQRQVSDWHACYVIFEVRNNMLLEKYEWLPEINRLWMVLS